MISLFVVFRFLCGFLCFTESCGSWCARSSRLSHFFFWSCFYALAFFMNVFIEAHDHFSLSDQNAADILPFAMFFACLALKDLRLFFVAWLSPFLGAPAVEAPCCPNRIVLIWSPCFATTIWDFFGWLGVRLGLLNPVTPALVSLGSFFAIKIYLVVEDKDVIPLW